MHSAKGSATAEAAKRPPSGAVGELSAGFPGYDLIHEIEACGAADWPSVARIADILMGCGSELVSLHARRYDKGDLVTCRIRGIDERSLESVVERIAHLPRVTRVSVVHHLAAVRDRPGARR